MNFDLSDWFRKMKNKNFPEEEILNFGLELAMEWGESWLKPVQERLSKAYPRLNVEELDKYNSFCQTAMNFGHKTVYEMAEKNGSETNRDEFKVILLQQFSWVSQKNTSHLFSQGMYYAWKDMGF
jgi:hypothetical protein